MKKNFEKLLRYVSIRPRSEKEIKDWLKRKNLPEDLGKGIFDDYAFAIWWVEQRKTFKLFSKAKIRAELLAKGVLPDIADQVLEEANIDDLETAKKAVEKKLARLAGYSSDEKIKKLANFLLGRGFSWDIIQNVLKYIPEKENGK